MAVSREFGLVVTEDAVFDGLVDMQDGELQR